MNDWVLQHQGPLQFYLWLGAFGAVAVWESFRPRRQLATGVARRWSRNIALTGMDLLLARFALPLTTIACAVLAQQHGWGLLNQFDMPFWLSCALAIAAIDLGTYGVHRLFHAVPLFWRCHKIHHADLDVDCSTALCHHPLEYLVVIGPGLLIVMAVGAPPLAVFVASTLDLAVAVFNHGNLALPENVDRMLRRLVVTPDMHRVHHSAVAAEGNRNFAGIFPWWDHLFATYQAAPQLGHERMALGLAEARTVEGVSLWKLLALPFRAARVPVSAMAIAPAPVSPTGSVRTS